jgi:hypothetical protein
MLESRFRKKLEVAEFLGMVENKKFSLEIGKGCGKKNTILYSEVQSVQRLSGWGEGVQPCFSLEEIQF